MATHYCDFLYVFDIFEIEIKMNTEWILAPCDVGSELSENK